MLHTFRMILNFVCKWESEKNIEIRGCTLMELYNKLRVLRVQYFVYEYCVWDVSSPVAQVNEYVLCRALFTMGQYNNSLVLCNVFRTFALIIW